MVDISWDCMRKSFSDTSRSLKLFDYTNNLSSFSDTSRSLKLFDYTNNLSSSPKFLFSISIRNSHSHLSLFPHPSNEELNHQRLTQLLQKCSKVRSLVSTKSLHGLSITMGPIHPQPIFIDNNLISIYASLGDLSSARYVFDEMPHRNVVSYNTMIGSYSRQDNAEEAWELFSEMRGFGFDPNQFTFGGLLSCASLDLSRGFYLQALTIKSGLFYADAFAGTALLGLFGRHGWLEEANRVFEDMPKKNLVTWNSMISFFGNHGFNEESIFMFRELMRLGMDLSEYSFVGVLSGFVTEEDLELGEQIHGLIIKNGFDFEVSIVNSLINMYLRCSGVNMAEKMFETVLFKDVVSWNTIIGALAKSNRPGNALEFFLKMRVNGVFPSQSTFVSVINSCSSLQVPIYGELIHAKTFKNMFESDTYVGSALVDFYAKCDKMHNAHRCFDEIDEKNVVSWNSLMLGYTNKSCSIAFLLLREMIQLGYFPNEFSFSIVLKSSSVLEIQQLHSLMIKMGYHQNEYVSSSLITSYAKHGLICDALTFDASTNMPLPVVSSNVIAAVYNRTGQYHKTQELFSVLDEPDTVSWNILIASCSRTGDFEEVFELFQHMQIAQICPDNYTYVSLFSVCTKLCNLALGSSLHGLIIKTDFECCDTFVRNIMIDMYGKCGSLESSLKIFDEMIEKNLISWTALVSVLGLHCRPNEALERFRKMEVVGIKPDRVAFVSLLSACRHGGLAKEGKEIFGEMKRKYGVEPDMDHYVLMVDLLAKYGNLKEAEELISSMPFPPNALVWRSFLEGCKRQQSVENRDMQHLNLELNP